MRKRNTPTISVEAGALVADVRAIVARSSSRARALSELGAAVENTIGELFHDAGARELRSVATQIQSSAHYVASLALELAAHAGELAEVASCYEAAAVKKRGSDD
jgi:hypothetical protein